MALSGAELVEGRQLFFKTSLPAPTANRADSKSLREIIAATFLQRIASIVSIADNPLKGLPGA